MLMMLSEEVLVCWLCFWEKSNKKEKTNRASPKTS
jgi:hypothetical protein